MREMEGFDDFGYRNLLCDDYLCNRLGALFLCGMEREVRKISKMVCSDKGRRISAPIMSKSMLTANARILMRKNRRKEGTTMNKSIIDKNAIAIIVRNMPEAFRNIYKSGEAIRMTIVRKKNLKGYGRVLNVRIWRDVMLDSDMTEYFPADRIARDVIGYFLYGEKAPVLIGYDGKDSVWNGDFGIRFSL